MKIQLAVDLEDLDNAMNILQAVDQYVEIIEAGTPLIIKEGIDVVKKIKRQYPEKQIVADLKIADGGKIETSSACKAGADIVTVLALAGDSTINKALEASSRFHCNIMVDLLYVNSLSKQVSRLNELGVKKVCAHIPIDNSPSKEDIVKEIKAIEVIPKNIDIAVAGGITPEIIPLILRKNVNRIIVGSAITNSPNPLKVAKEINSLVEGSQYG